MVMSRVMEIRLMKEENDDATPYLVSSAVGSRAVG